MRAPPQYRSHDQRSIPMWCNLQCYRASGLEGMAWIGIAHGNSRYCERKSPSHNSYQVLCIQCYAPCGRPHRSLDLAFLMPRNTAGAGIVPAGGGAAAAAGGGSGLPMGTLFGTLPEVTASQLTAVMQVRRMHASLTWQLGEKPVASAWHSQRYG